LQPDFTLYPLHLGPAKCAVDLTDGSERGEYVNQDYIFFKLGRPHRNINLMYCYYPLDQGWPARASKAYPNMKIGFTWDYPYDDYFPYLGGVGGHSGAHTRAHEPFASMRDVRCHGQDVTLTLTMDCAVPDEHLVQIAKELKPFGRMQLRINHEATGTWFAFNKRYSYQEVADFFVRFHRIVKQEAPNIRTIICIGSGDKHGSGEIPYEKEFREAVRAADIWSGDYYLALHWGWPHSVAERGGNLHCRYTVDQVWADNRFSLERFLKLNDGVPKPLVISEFNADGDVTGPYEQAAMMRDFYRKVKTEEATWLTGITFYQFRDRGRLGLEIEDPNNPEVGIEQPLLRTYRELIHDPYFMPVMIYGSPAGKPLELPQRLRWGGAEDADGLALKLCFETNPVFFEVSFEEVELNLIMEFNGQWFYKKPGIKTIDLMPAFYEKALTGPADLTFAMFAPPPTGENDPSQGDDWTVNYYQVIHQMPLFRIRYEPIEI
jgi:hypothetical protein